MQQAESGLVLSSDARQGNSSSAEALNLRKVIKRCVNGTVLRATAENLERFGCV